MTGGGALLGSDRCRHAEHVMGTVVSFDVPACAREPRGPAGQIGGPLGEAVRWLHWVDATFSPYRHDSDVSRFGRGALPLADCAPELAEVLEGARSSAHAAAGTSPPRRAARSTPPGT